MNKFQKKNCFVCLFILLYHRPFNYMLFDFSKAKRSLLIYFLCLFCLFGVLFYFIINFRCEGWRFVINEHTNLNNIQLKNHSHTESKANETT